MVDKWLVQQPRGLLVSVRLRSSSTQLWHTHQLQNSVFESSTLPRLLFAIRCASLCVCLWSLHLQQHPRLLACQLLVSLRLRIPVPMNGSLVFFISPVFVLAPAWSRGFKDIYYIFSPCSLPNRLVLPLVGLRSVHGQMLRIHLVHPHRPTSKLYTMATAASLINAVALPVLSANRELGYHGRSLRSLHSLILFLVSRSASLQEYYVFSCLPHSLGWALLRPWSIRLPSATGFA